MGQEGKAPALCCLPIPGAGSKEWEEEWEESEHGGSSSEREEVGLDNSSSDLTPSVIAD